MPVEVIHWNPRRPIFTGRIGRRLPVRRQVNNFGDLIGPLMVERLVEERGLDAREGTARLLSVGSIMHFGRPGDVVWGSGVNGKALNVDNSSALDVRAVRGPRTRAHLEALGAKVPAIYGDPALLWSRFWPRSHYLSNGSTERKLSVVPNLHDWRALRGHPDVVNPTASVHDVVRAIASSDFVVGSSLHGVVIADSLGVPARLLSASTEPSFKYQDYLEGSGRDFYPPPDSISDALRVGPHPEVVWRGQDLLDAFPEDLWAP